jgi:hypothetical protein
VTQLVLSVWGRKRGLLAEQFADVLEQRLVAARDAVANGVDVGAATHLEPGVMTDCDSRHVTSSTLRFSSTTRPFLFI